jgi:two-component sensor histidine kinase
MFVLARGQVKTKGIDPVFQQLTKSKPDSTRVRLFIQLAIYYFDEVRVKNNLDSVAFYLQQARLLNEGLQFVYLKNEINLLFAEHYCVVHPDADPRHAFLPAIDTCRKLKDSINEEGAWSTLAIYIRNKPQFNEFRIVCYQNGRLLAARRHDKDREMVLLRYIADIHLQQRKFNLAEGELLQILQEEKKIKLVSVMYAYDLLAALYMTKGDYDKALFYALKTEKTMVATGDSAFAATFYNRIATIYQHLGKPSQGIEWHKKSLNHSIWKNNAAEAFRTIVGITHVLLEENKNEEALKFILDATAKKKPVETQDRRMIIKAVGDCYNALNNLTLAEQCYMEVIKLGKEQKTNYPLYQKGADNYSMGLFYFDRGNYNKARPFLEIALKAYEEYGVIHNLKSIHLSLFKLDSALGNYVDAIRHIQTSDIFKDSIFATTKNKQIEELQISYETERKDQMLQLNAKNIDLLTNQGELQKSKLKQAATVRNITFATVTLLAIIVALLFNRYRIKQRANKKLELQQQEIERQNLSLRHLLTEKEWLLKEIHHRVKNNLQIVMSLLNSQSAYIENESALTAIHDSQHRVHAMSLIHQKLYNTENLSSIDMSLYIRELASYLADSFNMGQRIRFELAIEPLEMDVSQAVPLGLILNEAITNSIKYAFPNDEEGVIKITLSNTSHTQYLLEISDDGIGIPSHLKNKKTGSLGMSLMAGLSEDLDGSFSIENNNGTVIRILFVHDMGVKGPGSPISSFVTSN